MPSSPSFSLVQLLKWSRVNTAGVIKATALTNPWHSLLPDPLVMLMTSSCESNSIRSASKLLLPGTALLPMTKESLGKKYPSFLTARGSVDHCDRFPEIFSGITQKEWAPVAHSGNLFISTRPLYFFPLTEALPYYMISAFSYSYLNQLLAHKSLLQGQVRFCRNPKSRTQLSDWTELNWKLNNS